MTSPTVATRLVTVDDARPIAEIQRANREFFAPWDPRRPEEYFTVQGQRNLIESALHEHAQGNTLPHVIVADERVVGRVTLTGITRGPFLSARLGYWVAPAFNGRGVATAAVREIARASFQELGLHRLEASTLLHNAASQRVLEHNGFIRFGVAQRYLRIAGRWQDSALYQLIAPGG